MLLTPSSFSTPGTRLTAPNLPSMKEFSHSGTQDDEERERLLGAHYEPTYITHIDSDNTQERQTGDQYDIVMTKRRRGDDDAEPGDRTGNYGRQTGSQKESVRHTGTRQGVVRHIYTTTTKATTTATTTADSTIPLTAPLH